MVAIVNQLCNANESEGGLPIVILSEKEKVRGFKRSGLGTVPCQYLADTVDVVCRTPDRMRTNNMPWHSNNLRAAARCPEIVTVSL